MSFEQRAAFAKMFENAFGVHKSPEFYSISAANSKNGNAFLQQNSFQRSLKNGAEFRA
jgi:hypothetical protein